MTNKKKTSLSTTTPKLSEIKKEVYQLAQVKTTKILKGLKVEFTSLDFRRKASWEKALTILKGDDSFEEWRLNPPEKYKEIFNQIDIASKEHQTNLENTNKAFQKLGNSIKELDKLTKDVIEEASSLTKDNVVTIPISIPKKNSNKSH